MFAGSESDVLQSESCSAV